MPQVNKNNYNNSNKNKKSNTSNSSSDRNSKIWPEENQWQHEQLMKMKEDRWQIGEPGKTMSK